jgi:hypothetical protein
MKHGFSLKVPNTACSGQQGVVAFFKHFSGFGRIPFRQRIPPRPAATNASRWAPEKNTGRLRACRVELLQSRAHTPRFPMPMT